MSSKEKGPKLRRLSPSKRWVILRERPMLGWATLEMLAVLADVILQYGNLLLEVTVAVLSAVMAIKVDVRISLYLVGPDLLFLGVA